MWAGAAMVACGLAIVLTELLTLVVRAPRGRTLIVSRLGVALSCAHVVAALCLGAVIFSQDAPFAGLGYGRWLLIHLHVALLGWIALLILTVGRNLGPMLAQAPAAAQRTLPLEELGLVAGLWLLLAGIGTQERALTLAGGALVVVAIGRFASLVARVGLTPPRPARSAARPSACRRLLPRPGRRVRTRGRRRRRRHAAGQRLCRAAACRLGRGRRRRARRQALVALALGVVATGPSPEAVLSTRADSGSPKRPHSRSASSCWRLACSSAAVGLCAHGRRVLVGSAVLTAAGAALIWRRRARLSWPELPN